MPLFAQQTGQIGGKITDESTGESLIGINVVVNGTTLGGSTDIEGSFLIKKIPFGTYDVRVSGLGFTPKLITGISIASTQPVELHIELSQLLIDLNEVVVTAEQVRSTESAMLAQRKKAVTISDGITSEQIKRSPDATSSDALKRITGLTVVDNKFVFIRGITDRYNQTLLNGASVTSTEMGKKSFSFDLIPAGLLDNTTVTKSTTPDVRGDITGGLVNLHTLDFPATPMLKISLGTSGNSATTGHGFLSSQGGSYDWTGFDDGIRQFPEGMVSSLEIAKKAPNTWAPLVRKAPLNKSLSLSYGDRFDLSASDRSTDQLGYILALSYKNSFQHSTTIINDIALSRYNTGVKDQYSVLWGAIANINYKYGERFKISFKNDFNQSADDNVHRFRSLDNNIGLENQYTIVGWTQRSSYTGILSGEIILPALSDLAVEWYGSLSSSRREDPDRKEVTYYRDLYDNTQPYSVAINQRSWGHMNERVYSAGLDFNLPISNATMKVGSLLEKRTTGYGIRYFNVVPDYARGADSITRLPLDVVYSPNNYGAGKFLFQESSKATDSYSGDQTIGAAYLMADIPFSIFNNDFRITGGARFEHSSQNVYVPRSLIPGGPVTSARLKNNDVLPSINFTYKMNPSANLRLAYSHSVNRPDFRELAATGFYDFIKYELVGGNPDLRRAYIRNVDIRFEVFPDIGELVAMSYFTKNISDAIEEQLVMSSVRTRSWFNSAKASNHGWEFEFRSSFGHLTKYLQNFFVMGNYTRIQSNVDVVTISGNSTNTITTISKRPLQGQSPYVLNFSVMYTHPDIGTNVSILYNKFGRRLNAVGFLTSNIFEEAREVVDLSITQPLMELLEAKFTVKNLLDKDRVLTRGGVPYETNGIGTTYSMNLSLNL